MPERPLSIDIRRPLLLKDAGLFLVCEQDGHMPREWAGFGLFYRDCCYLGRYELALDGTRPLHLVSSWTEGFSAEIELTNAALETSSATPIAMHTLGITRRLIVLGRACTWVDAITLCNFSLEPVRFPLSLAFSAGFESIFVVRGAPPGRRGVPHAPVCAGDTITFGQLGADGVERSLGVTFSMAPKVATRTSDDTVASFDIALEARESRELVVAMRVMETEKRARTPASCPALPSREELDRYRKQTSQHWLDEFVTVESDAESLERVVRRSLSDLRLLRLEREGLRFVAAGVPWFVGLFGRDTLLPSLQCLAFDAEMAKQTAQLLARFQGERLDARRLEQPGKILHELRVGEMAHLGEIPQTPSYASVDSTLLFLILVARYSSWTGNLRLFEELEPSLARALAWLAEFGDLSGRGYVEYDGKTEQGSLLNQGWKDSGEAVVRKDGSFPEPPIALAEVQGYAYLAKRELAELYRSAGKGRLAVRLESEAAELRERFNRDFWMPAEGCYCMGLERGGRQICTITSNAGQVLFSGIADRGKALAVAERLMREDMFCGWGVRTMSSREVRYNPYAYQIGSCWPFDNSLIVAGLREYGLDEPATRIFRGMLDAACQFPHERLPEFFAGLSRYRGASPARCPRADPLQAWSAGAIPFMLIELLGLRPRAFEGKLRLVRPVLPDGVDRVELRGLTVGGSRLDLRFQRGAGGTVVPEVLALQGPLEIELDRAVRAAG